MKIQYLSHSGFYVCLEHIQLIFDYVEGEATQLRQDLPLCVFSSHSHGDHFSPNIFQLTERGCPVHFVLSDDIQAENLPDEIACRTSFVGPDERICLDPGAWEKSRDGSGSSSGMGRKLTDGDRQAELEENGLVVETLRSNDLGVAFLLTCCGRSIYHAGDLNNWIWDGDSEGEELARLYRQELDKIRGRAFDLAFIPLDPRMPEGYMLGVTDFLASAEAEHIFPMHMWKDYSVIDRLKKLPEMAEYCDKIEEADREGRCWDLP